jgi:O-antigen/teichoic acid export membrane protein
MAPDSDSVVRSLITGGGVLFLGFVFELSLSFGAKLLMARLLGKTDYGSVSIGIVLAANISTILLFGLNTGVSRYLPRVDDVAVERGLIYTAFVYTVPLATVVGILIYLFAEPIATIAFSDPSVTTTVAIFGIAIPFAVLMKLGIGIIRGKKLALPKALVRQFVQPISRFVFIATALFLGLASVGISWAYVTSYAVAALFALYFVVKHASIPGTGPLKSIRGELFSFSAPLAVSNITMLVFSGIGIDTFMLAYFDSTEAVANYNVVFPLANVLTLVFTSFTFLFMPILSELHADDRDDELRRIYTVVTKWVFLATLPLFMLFLLLPSEIISITFGAKYSEAGLTLSVLAIGFFSHTLVGPNENTLKSIGATRRVMYDNATAAIINIILNIALVPEYGILGAAIGTTVAYIVLNALYSYHAYTLSGVQPFSVAMLKPGAGAVLLAVLIHLVATTFFTMTPYLLLAVAIVYCTLHVPLILVLGGIEREEVMLVMSFEERFGIDLGPLKRIAKRLI